MIDKVDFFIPFKRQQDGSFRGKKIRTDELSMEWGTEKEDVAFGCLKARRSMSNEI